MKRKHFTGFSNLITTIRIGCVATIGLTAAHTYAGTPTEVTEAPAAEVEELGNWIEFTVGGVALNGDKAAFQQRARQDGDFFGGISSMHWEQEANNISWLLEGHLLFGTEDYDITLGAVKDGLGYAKGGFRQFRTWYDGSGGYVPGIPGAWIPRYDDDLDMDRGELWFEAGLRMENLPAITFGYSHSWRNGNKDSTSWGQSTLGYAIVPTLYDLDETRDTFTLDIAHTLGNTDLGLGFVYETVSNDNHRYALRQPGSLTSPGGIPNDRSINTHETYDYDLFSTRATSETRLNERMLMSFGYFFTNLNTDIGGSRVSTDVNGVNRPTVDHAYTALSGGANMSQHVANANFWWNPIDDLVIVPSFRAKWEDIDAIARFFEGGDQRDSSDTSRDVLAEEIEIRYTGIENLVLYAKGEFSQEDGDVLYRDVGGAMELKDADVDQQRYVVGANWYPCQGVSLAAQYYHRYYDRDYDHKYTGSFDPQLDSYTSETDDMNIRLTWRAMPNLTLVSRYDYQQIDYTNKGITGAGVVLSAVESGEATRHVFSQSATWMPFQHAYVQGNVSYVIAETDTTADKQVPFRIEDSDNDYVTANVTMGYALDARTNIQAGYTYYRAENFSVPRDAAGVPGSTPFGSDIEEHVFNVSLSRQINANMIWNMGYGYYTSNDASSGGHNDFDAHMVSTGLQIRF